MQRRTFLKTIFPTIFVPKIIAPVWKIVKPDPIYGRCDKYVLPYVTRAFPQILAEELVTVQPMNLPSGTVFYLDFVTTTEKDRVFTLV